MDVERLTEWLSCLRTPIVQAYAIRERDGFNLVDTTTAGQEAGVIARERPAPPSQLADWEVPIACSSPATRWRLTTDGR